MRKTTVLLIAVALTVLIVYYYIIQTDKISVTAQDLSPLTPFPQEGSDRAILLHALDFRGGPGFRMEGMPTAIYVKAMTLAEAQALFLNAPHYLAGMHAEQEVWLIVLEGSFWIDNEGAAQMPPPVTQMLITADAASTNPIFAEFRHAKEGLDTKGFTRYALPSQAEYAFPEPQPTAIEYTPIILDPTPTTPAFDDKAVPTPPRKDAYPPPRKDANP